MNSTMGKNNATVYTHFPDYGPQPFVVNIDEATTRNNTYRTALWTGDHLQLTLMSLEPGEDIGLEVHPDVDQFIRIEEGSGVVQMGPSQEQMGLQADVYPDYAVFVPAGTWHDIINTGNTPMKLYTIYGPPDHPWGTIQDTKADAEAGESHG